jgi:hypothetical protein
MKMGAGTCLFSFIHQWFYSPLLRPGLFLSFVIYTQSVRLLSRVISPSQGRYLHTGQHKHRINAHGHPCLKWDSNSLSQRSSERRQFMPSTARPLCSIPTRLYGAKNPKEHNLNILKCKLTQRNVQLCTCFYRCRECILCLERRGGW